MAGACGLTLLIVLALVVIGLLLPPISLLDRLTSPQYVALNAETPGVSHPDGLTLTIDPAQPGENFGVVLDSVPAANFASGAATESWVAEARSSLPAVLTLVSPIYSVEYEGTPPGAVALQISVPAAAQPLDTVDVYAYDSQTRAWEFVPTQLAEGSTALVTDLDYVPEHFGVFPPSACARVTAVPLDITQALTPHEAGLAGIVMPAGLQPTMQGTLQGSLAPNFQTGAGYGVYLTLRNFSDPSALDIGTVEALLGSEPLLAEHIRQITACAQSCYQGLPVNGITIDYRGVSAPVRAQFSRVLHALANRLHESNLSLAVVVPAAEEGADGAPWNTGAYDWRAIGRYADIVQILMSDNPADYASGGAVQRMLRWGVGEISRYKIQAGISAQSFRQIGTDTPSFVPISFEEAVAALGDVAITTTSDLHYFQPGTVIEASLDGTPATTGFDQTTQTPYIDYEGAGRIWLTNRAALLYRMQITKQFNIGGVAVRDLLAPGLEPDVLQALSDFSLNSAPPASNVELGLHWTVQASSGAIVAENTGGVGQAFQWEAVPDTGNYAINVEVVSGEQSSARTGQQVAVAMPTSTPRPTETPTPTPTPHATPAPVVQAPASSGSSAAPVVAAGRVSGSFEIGGHVADFNSAVPYMQSAGMRWVKVQVRYNYGGDPGGQAGIINAAHGAGLKILIGSVGYPNELGSIAEADYINAFAQFNAGLAGLGADAIEVWNEMNIDREWPTGRIDPNMYARMLAASYNAIKGRNGSTMVISGALAPTGAEGAFGTDRVWNDDRYYAGMASAGVANYADCIGAHYNEGIVPPDQVGGDPRGGFPSYVLRSMPDRAWGPFGGSRPICYTELGYLSPEGYGRCQAVLAGQPT